MNTRRELRIVRKHIDPTMVTWGSQNLKNPSLHRNPISCCHLRKDAAHSPHVHANAVGALSEGVTIRGEKRKQQQPQPLLSPLGAGIFEAGFFSG